MNILICDDHQVFGECLADLLTRRGHDVVAVTGSVDQALAVLRQSAVDVLLLDRMFPAGESVDRLPDVRSAAPGVRVVLLSAMMPGPVVRKAIGAGAAGIVMKSQGAQQVFSAIERVHRGETVVDASLLISAVAARANDRSPAEAVVRFLTQREREVLGRLVRGEGTSAIAAGLGVRHSTARTHIQSVLTKLGVHSRLEAAALAVRSDAVLP